MKDSLVVLGVLLLSVNAGCGDFGTTSDFQQGKSRPLTSLEQAVVASNNSFGFKLLQAVNGDEARKNVFISPVSVSMALGMTLNGANGKTRDDMAQTLGFGGMQQSDINATYKSLIALLVGLDPKVKFQIANSIWHRPDLNVEQNFKDVNLQNFNAETNSLDFSNPSAAKTINGWVDRNTNGRIKEIVPDPISRDMVMYLINAIYFKGTWMYRFDSSQTKSDFFTLTDGSRKPCRMMSQGGEFFYYADDRLQAIDLTYGLAGFSTTILLPSAGTNIDTFVSQMTQQQWNTWAGHMTKSKGDIFLPRFKLEYKKKLNETLIALGMSVAFDPASADFTNIDKRGNLFISEVLHKTFLQVDEEGTEAAAVTSVGIARTSIGPSDRFNMRVDRPFLLIIREHQSGTILFIGKVVEPVF